MRRRRRRRVRRKEVRETLLGVRERCPACGYPVQGLDAERCPECGRLLLTPGRLVAVPIKIVALRLYVAFLIAVIAFVFVAVVADPDTRSIAVLLPLLVLLGSALACAHAVSVRSGKSAVLLLITGVAALLVTVWLV